MDLDSQHVPRSSLLSRYVSLASVSAAGVSAEKCWIWFYHRAAADDKFSLRRLDWSVPTISGQVGSEVDDTAIVRNVGYSLQIQNVWHSRRIA